MIHKIDHDRINEVIEEICEDYCSFPDICETQERLSKHCDVCPLFNIVNEEYWEERNDNTGNV